MAIKYTNWLPNIPNGRKIFQTAIIYLYQHLPFTQIGIFGLKLWMPSGNPVGLTPVRFFKNEISGQGSGWPDLASFSLLFTLGSFLYTYVQE
jgi:hypothetical protein